jgi:competence protein ComEA
MFKKLLLACLAFIMTMGLAFADVEVNKADQAALDGVKGIGPTISKAIIAERTKNGDFKDWADLQKRVKGIGDKNSAKFSQAGLVVNGQAKAGASASASASASAPASASASAKAAAPAASAPASASASAPKK